MPLRSIVHSTARGKGRQHAAVPVGAERKAIGRFQKNFAACRIDGRHRALAENEQILGGQSKSIMCVKILNCLLVRCRAGHQIERHPHTETPRGGQQLFDVDLEESAAGDRADLEHALGMVEPQARALPAGNEYDANLPSSHGLSPAHTGIIKRDTVLCSIETEPDGRPGTHARSRKLLWSCPCACNFWMRRKSTPWICRVSESRPAAAQLVPKVKQMLLAERPKHGQQSIAVHVYQPMTMFDSMAFRACSKSVPVWCM